MVYHFDRDRGLYIPKERTKLKPVEKKKPTEWDCPNCGEHYDTTKQENEEATIGSLMMDSIPHIVCPKCEHCMGCCDIKSERKEND